MADIDDGRARVLTPVQIRQSVILLRRIEKAMTGKPSLVCISALIAAMGRVCVEDCDGDLALALHNAGSLSLEVKKAIVRAMTSNEGRRCET